MKFKNLSLTLLATVAFGAGISSDVSAAAVAAPVAAPVAPPADTTGGLLKRVANEAHEVASIDQRSQDELQKRMDAAKLKFNELQAVVADKSVLAKQASESLNTTVSLLTQQSVSAKEASAALDRAKAAFEGDEAYFLLLGLNDTDRAALLKLYGEKTQSADALARAAANIEKMSKNINTSKAELDAKNEELDVLNTEILAAANAESVYTQPQAEVKGEEVAAKEALLAQAHAKQAELNAAITALESKIRASDAKLAGLESRLPAAKAAKAADGGKAFQAILAQQKAERATKTADQNSLLSNVKQLEQLSVEIQQLQEAIAALNADIAALPAAVPGADPTIGESMADKLARLPKLKARITKLSATQDPAGKLQTALKQVKADLDKLEAQVNLKQNEINTFKDNIIAQRAAGGAAPVAAAPAVDPAPALLPPPPGSAVSPAPVEGMQPALAGAAEGSAVPPVATEPDVAVKGSAPLTKQPSRAELAEQKHVGNIGAGRRIAAGTAGNFNPPLTAASPAA